MPPKPQVFKTPDGKEFTSKTEWRDYMMATFYSFKNKVNEPEPLIKAPGSVDGQNFDIADCENSTLVIMDHTEQIQVDQVKGSKIFIGACGSSVFIRNCDNCTFYVCCRQLRLREVTNSKFYVYSMAEVHIEYSNGLLFAPFNGGYPEHASHLRSANIDNKPNLWYDIYDHNDSAKSKVNWGLLPESEYEEPWFPTGQSCELAVPRTKAGSVEGTPVDAGMQSFSLQQMVADSKASSPKKDVAPPTARASVAKFEAPVVLPPTPPAAAVAVLSAAPVVTESDPLAQITSLLSAYAAFIVGSDLSAVVTADCIFVHPSGEILSVADFAASAPIEVSSVAGIEKIAVSEDGKTALALFWLANESNTSVSSASAFLVTNETGAWRVAHLHQSVSRAV